MDLFFKKKSKDVELNDKRIPLGPPNLTEPSEFEAQEEPSIKEQVGFPPEGQEEAPYQEGYEEPSPQAEFEEEPLAPPPGEFPPFLPPPPGYQAQAAAPQENFEDLAARISDDLKKEFEEKLDKISKELEELKKIDEEIQKSSDSLDNLREKYSELEGKISSLPTHMQEDIDEIKAVVNNLNQIMSVALPALIREVRDLKEKK